MEPRAAAALLLLAGAPSLAVADGWLGAGAGGGWDSNVNLGVADTPAVAAGFASVRAHAGLGTTATEAHELSIEAAYEGTFFPELSDLDIHRPSLSVGWATGDATRLRVVAFAGLRATADPARSGWDGGATASVRHRLRPSVSLRASGGYTRREADDPAFDTSILRGQAGIDLRLGGTLNAWFEYGAEGGTETITRLPTGASSRRVPTRPTDSYGASLISSPTTIFTHGPAAGVWIPLGRGFSLAAAFRQSWILSDGVAGSRRLVTADLAWAIPFSGT